MKTLGNKSFQGNGSVKGLQKSNDKEKINFRISSKNPCNFDIL